MIGLRKRKPLLQIISFTGISWIILISTMSYYCYLYGVVYAENDDFMCYLKWALWSWCIWLVLIPVTYKKVESIIRAYNEKEFSLQTYGLIKLGIAVCIIALLVQLLGTVFSKNNWLQDIYYYLPTNIKIFIMTVLAAFVFLQKSKLKNAKSINKEPPKLKCLNNNNEETLIPIKDISWLTAYGNYVQVHTLSGMYLIRTTMKKMEIQLDNHQFIRIHRSHIINKSMIKSLKYRNGQLILDTYCDTRLPIGRSYKKNISKQPLQTAR